MVTSPPQPQRQAAPLDEVDDDHHPFAEDERDSYDRKREEYLIKQLRDEAYAVRDCFTQYSFQGLAVSMLGLGAIAKFQIENPFLGLLAILPILLLFGLASMGTHKYATSNRLLGYELHLQRTRHYSREGGWWEYMRQIGWEEAMRAWRIVSATLFEHIYTTRRTSPAARRYRTIYDTITWRFRPDTVRSDLALRIPGDRRWFEPWSLLNSTEAEHATYYAGGYLKTMLNVLGTAILTSTVVMGIGILNMWTNPSPVSGWRLTVLVPQLSDLDRVDECLGTWLFLVTAVLSLLRWRHIRSRLNILEGGMLSIHSCAIVWEAAVLAHFGALRALGWGPAPTGDRGRVQSFRGYTEALGREAADIAHHAYDIHQWLDPHRRSALTPPTARGGTAGEGDGNDGPAVIRRSGPVRRAIGRVARFLGWRGNSR